MSVRIVAPGLVLVAAIVACHRSNDATAEKPGARVLASIEGKHPCTHQSLAITGAPQLSNQERCALVEAGVEGKRLMILRLH
jgi:hypothetical protein